MVPRDITGATDGQPPPTPYQEIEIYADGAFILKFAQQDTDILYQAFRLMSNAYWMVRNVYPLFGLALRVRATLDFNLHAGRSRYDPVLVGGRWTAGIDASKPFEEAFAELTLHFTRAASLSWTIAEAQDRLRIYWQQNMPEHAQEG